MSYKITSSKKLDTHEQEIEVTIESSLLESKREESIKAIGAGLKMDGFRDGHIPEKVIVSRVGEVAITEESGRSVIEELYPEILKEAKIKTIGYPKILITKVAPGEPFGIKLTIDLAPEVTLGKYAKEVAKLNKEIVTAEATDEEVEAAIVDLQKQVAHAEHHKANADDHNHDHGELPLPDLTDEFVKKFGPFENVDAFKKEVKKGLSVEKERKEKDKKKVKIINSIVDASKFVIPQTLVDRELDRMVRELEGEISRMGLTLDAYLGHLNKSIDDLKKEWVADATKRVNTQLAFSEIATAEKITVGEAEIKEETDKIIAQYKDADKIQAAIFAETVLMNEKVWAFIESIKE